MDENPRDRVEFSAGAPPRATYRLQLHPGLTFKDAAAIVPYLAKLGISHVYCSPYFQARSGSTHGYDIVRHNQLNPEIGTREDFENFVAALQTHRMAHIVDFVPNHVGIMGNENPRWLDVLAKGETSEYATFFDIDWHPADPTLDGKVLVPILGDTYGAILERGELQLRHDPDANSYAIHYHDHLLPINPAHYPQAGALLAGPNQPPLPDALHELLEQQAYRLAHWRVASDEVNYRRFFDVNDLAALRMENEAVFEETHRLLLELLQHGKVDGVRIDHPDGLYDPAQYFSRLQSRSADVGRTPLYLLAEKITAPHERLPRSWPIAGTTGYDFANLLNGLFVDPSGRGRLDRTWRAFTGEERSWDEIVFDSKQLILRTSLAAEVSVLANQIHHIARADRRTRDYSLNALRHGLRDLIACFPVYRTYIAESISAEDQRYIEWAIQHARRRSQAADVSIFDFLADILLGRMEQSAELARQTLTFVMKFQQVTSPAAAKGVEDTAFYRFTRLVSLNEVGGDPQRFGVSVAGFHRENARRLKEWPHAMLASSTHDTKRSEDVRARINVISELPGVWRSALARWNRMNRSYKVRIDDAYAPTPADEYLLYQTLIGTWALETFDTTDLISYAERIENYMVKAAREAKLSTSWANVNGAYENALKSFVRVILTGASASSVFLADFVATQSRFAQLGTLNSLSQTALKLTVPGMPDVYQGNELWDFSLVDPDNRRPVDYRYRSELLDECMSWNALSATELHDRLSALAARADPGRAKLYLTWCILRLRNEHPELFSHGRYIPLQVRGSHTGHVCAFARTLGERTVIVIVPRLLSRLLPTGTTSDYSAVAWNDTEIVLKKPLANGPLTNIFDRTTASPLTDSSGEWTLRIDSLLKYFPIAVLKTHSN